MGWMAFITSERLCRVARYFERPNRYYHFSVAGLFIDISHLPDHAEVGPIMESGHISASDRRKRSGCCLGKKRKGRTGEGLLNIE